MVYVIVNRYLILKHICIENVCTVYMFYFSEKYYFTNNYMNRVLLITCIYMYKVYII